MVGGGAWREGMLGGRRAGVAFGMNGGVRGGCL